MGVKKDHHVSNLFLFIPRPFYHLKALFPDPLDRENGHYLIFKHIKGLFSEGLYYPLCEHGPYSLYKAGAKVSFYSIDGGGN